MENFNYLGLAHEIMLGRTQYACSWCHHEINADHTQGKAIEDKDWKTYRDHGICLPCAKTGFPKRGNNNNVGMR